MKIEIGAPCILHGHIVAEWQATETGAEVTFPVILEGPEGERSQELTLDGKPTGRPGVCYLLWDAGNSFELAIAEKDATYLHLPNLGPVAVQEEAGTTQAYRSRVTVIPTASAEIPFTLRDVDCIVVPGAEVSSLGEGYAWAMGLGVITTPPKAGEDSTVKLALYVGV